MTSVVVVAVVVVGSAVVVVATAEDDVCATGFVVTGTSASPSESVGVAVAVAVVVVAVVVVGSAFATPVSPAAVGSTSAAANSPRVRPRRVRSGRRPGFLSAGRI
ncbi:hypothetical protein [Rhodococcus kronopolitis]|uniref:Secreted peptide n=1 Tax=Rhodococcus kronopolitis TaxID=1460226 RepID=A0ABV9G0F8_9NOCA